MVRIEGVKIKGKKFCSFKCSYFILEDKNDEVEAIERGFNVYDLELLPASWANNDFLFKTISNWKLTKKYIERKVIPL